VGLLARMAALCATRVALGLRRRLPGVPSQPRSPLPYSTTSSRVLHSRQVAESAPKRRSQGVGAERWGRNGWRVLRLRLASSRNQLKLEG
jgi:hypothetical protein